MITISKHGKRSKKNLVIFVHGLTGDDLTWINENGESFADLLFSNREIKKKFDMAHFTYFSKFYNLRPIKYLEKIFASVIPARKRIEINLKVDEITDLFITELELKCSQYENIVLVAHSLGGLISKNAILRLIFDNSSIRIKKFVSIAVPHDGATLALIGSLLSPNAHIKDLKPLGDTISDLNQRWIQQVPEVLPDTIYFQGKYDTVVNHNSSIGYEPKKQVVQYFEADHTSIAKPNSSSSIYIAMEKILLSMISDQDVDDALNLKVLKDRDSFNDDYFVLKLLIADVHHKNIHSAKTCFYNAEFFRKIVVTKKILTVKEFETLYSLIEGLYNTGFGLLTTGKIQNGNELVVYVHNKIEEEDQKILKTISSITFIHKTGMLHQLANMLDRDIWWQDGQNLDNLKEHKSDKPQ